MDNLTEKGTVKKKEGLYGRLRSFAASSLAVRKSRPEILFYDISVFVIAFLFSRSHVIFGAYPLAVSFLAVLPSFVWQGLLGACIGAVTLGKAGIIYAMISVVVVFLRIIVSGTDKRQGSAGTLFSEGLLLRMSSSIIGGFIAAVYEALLSGFSTATVMFGLSMLLFPPIICFGLSGLFDVGITFSSVFRSSAPIFRTAKLKDRDKYNIIFFQGSALLLLFLISLSLSEYQLLGIGAAYVFSSAAALASGRRFGALRAMAVGFVTSVGISGVYSVSFALVGLVSGVLFKLGAAYAVVGAGVALSLFSGYTGGVGGFVSTFPEYAIAASLSFVLLCRIPMERTEDENDEREKIAAEMVGTMALSYRNKYSGSLDALEASFVSLSLVMKKHGKKRAKNPEEEYASLASRCAEEYLFGEGVFDFDTDMRDIGRILASGAVVTDKDISPVIEEARVREGLAAAINRASALYSEEQYRLNEREGFSFDFDLIGKLISEARKNDEREKVQDEDTAEKIRESLASFGLTDGSVKVLGKRKKHIIVAAEDSDGTKISSRRFLDTVEDIVGAKLASPDFFRRGSVALMECDSEPVYKAESATASVAGSRERTSGDVARTFLGEDGRFYSIISDGMGSGEEARDTAEFVADFLGRALEFGSSKESVLKILNHVMRRREGECSATVDLFSYDLFTGESGFIKSGAAPSYLKRGSSIFRIRSRTAPIGLMRELDAERVKVDAESEDYIIMLSDGISQSSEDSPWLIELLSRPPKKTLADYADHILSSALAHTEKENRDDMTVTVVKISKR